MSGFTIIGGERISWRELPRQEETVNYNDPKSKREWLFDGSINRASIKTAVAASGEINAFDTSGGIVLFLDSYELKELGGGAWSVPVNYRKNPAYWELSIDTTGGTGKLLQSYNTVKAYDCSGNSAADPAQMIEAGAVPDFKRAIGVNGNNVEGVDMIVPKFDFSINYKFKMSILPASYLMTLYDLTGKANGAAYTLSWKGQSLTFSPGELRFMGAPARQTSDDDLDLTFKFSASKSLSAVTGDAWNGAITYAIGDLATQSSIVYRALTTNTNHQPPSADYWEPANLAIADSGPISKKGWEYLWVYYEEATDPATGRLVRKPIAVYVEQVVKYGDFSLFGI